MNLIYDDIMEALLKVCSSTSASLDELVIKVQPSTYQELRTEGVEIPDFENKYNQHVEYRRNGEQFLHGALVQVKPNLSKAWKVDKK